MNMNLEKRVSTRKAISGSITLHTAMGWAKDVDANLINHSERGLCFTTKSRLVPGTTVLFKSERNKHLDAAEDENSPMRSIGMLTVKWCKEDSGRSLSAFVVGATYMANRQ